MFNRILVAADGSEGSDKALNLAIKLKEKCANELIILTVYRHHSLLETSMSMVRPEEPELPDDALRDYAKSIVEDAKEIAKSAGVVDVRGFVKSGQPARTIVTFAKEHDADLIVLGSRGLGDVEGFLLGSVSHKVTSLSKKPVLVV